MKYWWSWKEWVVVERFGWRYVFSMEMNKNKPTVQVLNMGKKYWYMYFGERHDVYAICSSRTFLWTKSCISIYVVRTSHAYPLH